MTKGVLLGIRVAEQQDLPILIQLRLDFLTESFRTLTTVEKQQLFRQLTQYFTKQLEKLAFVVLAYLEKQVVSTAFLVVDEHPANLSYPNGRVGTVLNVYTFPEYRGKGFASQFMRRLIWIAEEQKLGELI